MSKKTFLKSTFVITLGLSILGFSISNAKTLNKSKEVSATSLTNIGYESGEYKYYTGDYYDAIGDSTISTGGTTLISELSELIQPSEAFGYNNVWTFNEEYDLYPSDYDGADPLTGNTYPTTDNIEKRGRLWDMYSDKNWKTRTDRAGNYSTVGDVYNREHSMPKSWFGGSDSNKPGTDPNHLFNTDGKVNGVRNNFAYGEVKNVETDCYTMNPSCVGFGKLGTNSSGKTVFEPHDAYKGDFARAQMYMATAYYNWDLTQEGNGADCFTYSNGVSSMKQYYIDLLTKWSENDPVSQKEIDRNNGVYAEQENRNPFIDHPGWANKIWGGTEYTWGKITDGVSTISRTSATLLKGGNTTTINATSANNETINWSTSNANIVNFNGSSNTTSANGANVTLKSGNTTGTATIAASVDGSSNTKTCTVTVSDQEVILSLNETSVNIESGNTTTITATVNGGSGSVTWETSNSDIASLSITSGNSITVTGVSSGTATVTASYSGQTATCIVIVISSGGGDGVDPTSGSYVITNDDLPTSYPTTPTTHTADSGISFTLENCGNFINSVQFKKNGGYLYNNDPLELTSIVLNMSAGNLTVYGGSSSNPSDTPINGTNGTYDLSGYNYFKIINETDRVANCSSIIVNISSSDSPTPTIALSLNQTSIDTTVGSNTTITATATGGNGNIAWATTNENIVSLDTTTGTQVTISALVAGTVTITASYSGQTATCIVTVTSSGGGDGVDPTSGSYVITKDDLPTSYPTTPTTHTADSGISFTYCNCGNNEGIQFKRSSGYLYNNDPLELTSIVLNISVGNLTVYGGSSSNPSDTHILRSSNGTYDLNGYSYFKIINETDVIANCSSIIVNISSSDSPTPTISLSLDQTSIDTTVGSNVTITATASGGSGSVTWETSNSDIASLSTTSGNSITVTGVSSGTATITASYSGQTATCTITVNASSKTLSSITLDTTNVKKTFNPNETFDCTGLVVTANYSNSTSETVTPTSISTPDMTTVGNKTVTVSYTYEDTTKTADYTITINSEEEPSSSSILDLSNGLYDPTNKSITWNTQDVGATVTQSNGNGTSDVDSSYVSEPRIDKGHILTFTANGNRMIASVAINYLTTYAGNSMTAGTSKTDTEVIDNPDAVARTWSTAESGTHVVSAVSPNGLQTIHIQNVASVDNTQLRIGSITITYVSSSSTDPSPTDEATAWASTFMSAVIYDNAGKTSPNFASGYSWSTLAASYAGLSNEAKEIFITATYGVINNTVVPEGEVNHDVAECVAKYDLIVYKYGAPEYNNFMNRTISPSPFIVDANTGFSSSTLLLIVAASISLVAISTFCIVETRKRKVK